MSTTVKELIEYLKSIPYDTELKVIACSYSSLGCDVQARLVPLDINPISGNVEYIDTKNNPLFHEDSVLWDRRFLEFGEMP